MINSAKEAKEILKKHKNRKCSCGFNRDFCGHRMASAYLAGMKEPAVKALLEALADISHGISYGASQSSLKEKAAMGLATYREATTP